jgi:hypothetical protein
MESIKKIGIKQNINEFFIHSVSMSNPTVNAYTLHEEQLLIPISKKIKELNKKEQEEIFDVIATLFNKNFNDQDASVKHVTKKLDEGNYPYFEAIWLLKTKCEKCHEINIRTRMQFLRIINCLNKITLPIWKIDRGEGNGEEEGIGWKKFNNPRELTEEEKTVKIIKSADSAEEKARQILALS